MGAGPATTGSHQHSRLAAAALAWGCAHCRAIEAGDSHSGITIMQMDAGLDTGDMLLREAIPIAPDETTGTLHDRLALLGAHLAVQALQQADSLERTPQPEKGCATRTRLPNRNPGSTGHSLRQSLAARPRVHPVRAQ